MVAQAIVLSSWASALKNLIALFSLFPFCTHLLDWHRRLSFSLLLVYGLIIDE